MPNSGLLKTFLSDEVSEDSDGGFGTADEGLETAGFDDVSDGGFTGVEEIFCFSVCSEDTEEDAVLS